MRSNFILTLLILSLIMISPLLFGEDVSDRPIVLIHGLNGSSKDMETMKNELIKKGVPENNIKLINLPKNKGSIIESATYVGNEIKKISEEFGGKKAMVVGYSMGGEIADFLTKNQEKNVTYAYDKAVMGFIDTPLGKIPKQIAVETVIKTIQMPTHMEKYIDEVIMIGSGPSKLAGAGYTTSLVDTSFLAYQDLMLGSYFQNKLNSMNTNPLVVYNTISGTNTWGNEKDDDVVPNEYSQRDYAKNNYMVEKITHTRLTEDSEVINLVLQEKSNGALPDNEIRDILEYQKDRLTLQKNSKQYSLSQLMKDAPCGAKTTEMTVLNNEINSIDQQIAGIEGQISNFSNE